MVVGNIEDYYSQNFLLKTDHNFSITEIENMLPFEKEIYVSLIIKRMQETQK